jgi:hypothetical protein
MIGASAQILRQPFRLANRAVSIVCGAIRFRLGARRLERERGQGGRRETGRPSRRALVGERKTVIAVEFAHDCHDAVDRVKVGARHRAICNDQRLVEAAHLQRQKLGGRLGARPVRRPRTYLRMPRSVTPSRAAILAIDAPRFRKLTTRLSRLAFRRRAAFRAAGERSRRRVGAGLTGSDKEVFSDRASENKHRITFRLWARNCRNAGSVPKVACYPFPALLGKVARSAGWGVVRCSGRSRIARPSLQICIDRDLLSPPHPALRATFPASRRRGDSPPDRPHFPNRPNCPIPSRS